MEDDAGARRALLREFLERMDEPCPGCGYSLKGLTGDACPECGEELVLRVGALEPRLGIFVVGLIGLSAGTGFNGVMTVFGAVALLVEWDYVSGRDVAVLALLAGACAAGVGAIFAWVRGRGWVRRRSRRVRVGLALACCGFSVSTVAAFLWLASG